MAVRFDAVGDTLNATADLPTNTSFTFSGCSLIVSDLGAGTIQPLLWALDGGSTDGYALQWNAGGGVMSLEAYDAGAPSSNTSFGTRPALLVPFHWYIKCSGTAAGQLEAGWRPIDSKTWTRVTATLAATIAQVTTLYLGGVAGAYYANHRKWNVKGWDRPLTDEEIDLQALYEPVVIPRGLYFDVPLPHAGDTFDRSPHRRHPAKGGTLTTEPHPLTLLRRPWQVPVDFTPAGGDVELALTGIAATASAGTLTPNTDKALSGQAATGSAGTLAPAVDKALSGQAATAAAGTLAPSTDKALSGQAATAGIGTVVPNIDKALTGEAATTAAGTVTPEVGHFVALTGIAATAGIGTVGPAVDKALAGSATTASAGTVSASSANYVGPLTFGSKRNRPGRGPYSVGRYFVGQTRGFFTDGVPVSVAITGIAATASVGSLAPSTTKALTGSAGTAGIGTAVPSTTAALTGIAATAADGDVSVDGAAEEAALTGIAMTAAAGSVRAVIERAITGAQMAMSVGSVQYGNLPPELENSSEGSDKAWLPSPREPIGMIQRDGSVLMNPAWYRAFRYVFYDRLGGPTAPTVTDIVTTVEDVQGAAATTMLNVSAITHQVNTNAQVLHSLPGGSGAQRERPMYT